MTKYLLNNIRNTIGNSATALKGNSMLFTNSFVGLPMFFKSIALALAMLVVGIGSVWGQTTVTVGTGTATHSYLPIYSCYGYNYSQQIYIAAEITAGGGVANSQITQLRFRVGATPYATTNFASWSVRIGNTALNNFTGTTGWVPAASMTQVFNGNIPVLLSNGWMTINLTTPITWTGGNLVVAVDENTPGYNCTQAWYSFTTAAAAGPRSILYYSDFTNPDPSAPPTANYSSTTVRSQVQFVMTPISACSGTPNAGTAAISASSGCASSTVSLSASGITAGTGITYQWQSGPSATGPWTNVAGATASSANVTPTATTFYRLVTTCSNSGLTNATNAVSYTVNTCTGSFTMTDSYGDGWNGATMTLNVNGVPFATYGSSFTAGTSQTVNFCLPANSSYTLVYGGGGLYPTEVGASLTINGSVVYSVGAGGGTVGATLTSGTACPIGCSGAPNAGAAAASITSVCSGSTSSLSATGLTTGGGITYQWQSSPNNTTWTNIAGATSSTYNATVAATTYYRLVTTCTNSGLSANSSSVLVNTVSCCNYTFLMTDSWGDGWDGATMQVRIGTTVVQTIGASFTTGTSQNVLIPMQSGTGYNLFYAGAGLYPTEVGIQIIDANNTTIYTLAAGGGTAGTQLTTWTANCPTPCSGAPSAANASANPSQVFAGGTTTLSLSPAQTTSGITYQWQSSTNNSTWTNIGGATGATYVASPSGATYYRCVITCSNSGQSTNSGSTYVTFNAYCNPAYTSGTSAGDLISNVVIAGTTLSNNTGITNGTPYYQFYTGQLNYTANLVAANSYNVSVTAGSFTGQNFAAWIDYNDNNVFEASEKIGFSTAATVAAYETVTFPINLSCTPPLGNHRMRIRGVWLTAGNTIDPCATYGWGETEDYVITIVAGAAFTPAFTATPTTPNCVGTQVTYSATAGQTNYSWIPSGVNGTDYTINSGGTSTSNTITITWLTNGSKTMTMNYASPLGCASSGAVSNTISISPDISWANVQWPANASVNCGSGANIYGQVYSASLTPTAGVNNTIGVQIGVSSSNTNPATWPAGAWTNANYNVQSGNNDEYVANIGSNLAQGTYYYAYRYTTGTTGCYVYGGTGGFWNGTSSINGVLTVGGLDWANLQSPGSGSMCQGGSYNVYGQAYKANVTNAAGATAGLVAEIGVSSTNTNPSTWAANAWSNANFNVQVGNNDEFIGTISGLAPGTYYYAFRYKLANSCNYEYGGFNAGGGGFWNGSTNNVNGTLTVTTLPSANAGLDIIDPSTCGKNTVTMAATALNAGESGVWTLVSGTNANGIFSLPTAANTQFTGSYGGSYVLQWALTSGGCTGTDQVTVTFNQPSDASISALIGSGDLLWCGLTNTDWSTSTNWYQKQAAGHYVRMSGTVQPGITNEVFTLSTANGGLCIGNSTPSLSVNSNAEDVYLGTGGTLNLSNDSINIAQNLVNNGTIIASTGVVIFTGSNNSIISGSGNTQLFSMRVNKSAGATLTLQKPVLVTNNLNMVQGNVFTTSANVLTLGTSSAAPGSLTYNSGTIVGPFKRYFANAASAGTAGLFPVGTAVYNRYADFSFGSGPGVDQFLTVEYITGAPLQGGVPLYNGLPLTALGSLIQNYSADGYWSVIPTNNNYAAPITSVNYGVTLFANNLTGMQSPQVCRIIKSAGSNTAAQHHVAWQACGTHTPINGAANPQSFLITSTATQGFSWFNIGTPNSQALPVELLSFNGDCNEGQVNLSWQTATEHNSDYFEVEKSRDGMNWQVLTTVNAAGNSTQLLNYEALDVNAMEGNNYYRLTQVDIDGTTKTYDVINVSCSGAAKGYFSAYPNPSTGSFQVILNDKNLVGTGSLSVKDTKGSELLNRTIEVKPGINMFSVTDLNLAPGVYYIQIVNGERATEVLKEVIR